MYNFVNHKNKNDTIIALHGKRKHMAVVYACMHVKKIRSAGIKQWSIR